MTDINARLAQHGAHNTDHPWLVGVAAEEHWSLWHKLRPVATDTHNTRIIMHNGTA